MTRTSWKYGIFFFITKPWVPEKKKTWINSAMNENPDTSSFYIFLLLHSCWTFFKFLSLIWLYHFNHRWLTPAFIKVCAKLTISNTKMVKQKVTITCSSEWIKTGYKILCLSYTFLWCLDFSLSLWRSNTFQNCGIFGLK